MSKRKAALIMSGVALLLVFAFVLMAIEPNSVGSSFDPVTLIFVLIAGGFALWVRWSGLSRQFFEGYESVDNP